MSRCLANVRGHKWLCICALAAVVILGAGGVALAQTGGPYGLEWNAIAGGGGSASGGSYSLDGTVGQAIAGVEMTGGGYGLTGGFMAAGGPSGGVFMPMVQSSFKEG